METRQRKRHKGATGLATPADEAEQIQSLDDDIHFARRNPSVDAMWNLNYQELAKFYKKNGHLRVERGYSLYNWMILQRRRRRGIMKGYAPLTDEQIQLLDDINFAWDPVDSRWNSQYQKLAKFYEKHGHLRVEYGGSLYRWMERQRKRHRGVKGAPLTDVQIRLLDDINFAWDPLDSMWSSQYQELAKFYEKHGHLRVEYQGSLYKWMERQREKRKGAKGLAPLTDEQIQLLDEIDFDWDPIDSMWNSQYQELAKFYKTHGHLRVQYRGSLYRWMGTQRRKRSGMNGRSPLTDEQIQLLDEIGFDWDPFDSLWNSNYQELAKFYKKYGHLRVESKGSLYNWMGTQRKRHKGEKGLTDEQIQLLDEIGFDWDPVDSMWNSQYQELAKFYEKHGHLRVEYGGSLYAWMERQRKRRRGVKGAPLTDEQIQLLDEIGFTWNPREEKED